MTCFRAIASAAVGAAVWAGAADSALPAEPPQIRGSYSKDHLDVIDFRNPGVKIWCPEYFGPFLFEYLEVKPSGGSAYVARLGAQILKAEFPVERAYGKSTSAHVSFGLTELRRGDIVPVIDSVYQVTEVESSPQRIVMRLVSDPAILKELKIESGSVAVPISTRGGAEVRVLPQIGHGLDSSDITIEKIVPAKQPEARAHAVVKISGDVPYLGPLPPAHIKAGTEFSCTHEVTAGTTSRSSTIADSWSGRSCPRTKLAALSAGWSLCRRP